MNIVDINDELTVPMGVLTSNHGKNSIKNKLETHIYWCPLENQRSMTWMNDLGWSMFVRKLGIE